MGLLALLGTVLCAANHAAAPAVAVTDAGRTASRPAEALAAVDADAAGDDPPVALAVSVSAAGSYVVTMDGIAWLASGGAPDHLGRNLTVLDRANSTGEDKHGAFVAVTLRWQLDDASMEQADEVVLVTEFKTYASSGLLAFTQSWPLGVPNTSAYYNQSTAAGSPLGRFPSFAVGNTSSASPELNWFAFSGCQIQFTGFGRWASSGPGSFRAGGAQETMPLVLYNRSLRAVAVSPSTNYFNAVHDTATSGGSVLAAGVMASIWTLPPGFSHTTLVVGGQGINATMTKLGVALLKETGKTPVNPLNESFVLSHLGYWVDNGAPYYHTTAGYNVSLGMEACISAGTCTQEDALKAVQADFVARKIPIRYMQWDDWAPLMWNWPPRAFPDGAKHWLGNDPHLPERPFPLSLYNGLWNGGAKVPFLQKYAWAGEGDSICIDPEFFKAIFANGSKAGMIMMEQDYLCSSTSQTSRDLSVGPKWFHAMDEAAAGAEVDMQLCMMNPAHALASTLIHSASNGRGTGDHVVRNAARGLPLGWSGMLLWSVGMWPSRDNVWTNSSVNVSGLNMETDPEGQTAMAVLAGGPYGPADVAGAMNRSLIMRSCREDGVLLRADKPATAIDYSWSVSFDTLEPIHAWGTFSQVGTARWSYLLGLNLAEPLHIPPSALDPAASRRDTSDGWVAYEGWHGIAASATTGSVCHTHKKCFQLLSGSDAGTPQELVLPSCPQVSDMTLGHTLWNVAPVLPGGWVYLGETDKIVAVSGRRLSSWNSTTSTLTLTLLAAPNETLSVAVLQPDERDTATIVQCVAASGSGSGSEVSNAYGDVDITVTVKCEKASRGPTCTC